MNQRPVGDRIIVKPDAKKETTKGGIFIAETAKEKVLTGTVVAIGNETKNTFEVKVGNRVRYGQYSGTEIQEDGEETLLLMREDEIFTIIG